VTEHSWPLRVQRLFSHLWVDGLGAWAPGRHGATVVVSAGAAVFLLVAALRARARRGDASAGGPRGTGDAAGASRLLALSAAAYFLWILLFQNVIHQTRHVLPLVPPLLMLLAAGLAAAWNASAGTRLMRIAGRATATVFLAASAFVGTSLAVQHTRPAAIAQAKAYVETFADSSTVIVAAPWVEKCLSAQGVRARFWAVETPAELAALPARLRALPPATRLAAVGDYRDVIARPVAAHRTFHHNPYVNRLGARIEVFVYEAAP
jgi:hypothetical protein